MSYDTKKASGMQAVLYRATKGALIEGTGAAALDDVKWFQIAAMATATELPIKELTAIFKSPDSATPITPAIGDNVYPLTLTEICKGDIELNLTKGTYEEGQDDCDNGFINNIPDGYVGLSGSFTGFIRMNRVTGALSDNIKVVLAKFFPRVEDNGAGVYTVTAKDDDDMLLFILWDKSIAAEGQKETWLIVPVTFTGAPLGKPRKGTQALDIQWSKGEGWAGLYERTLTDEDVA